MREDKICSMLAKKRGFKVSLYYRVLTRSSDQSFPWKSIWKPKVPSRVTFFFFFFNCSFEGDVDN